MKAIAYTVYVITVLLISGLSRANAATLKNNLIISTKAQYQTPIQIEDVAQITGTLELAVAGDLPNPCYPTPYAFLTQETQNPNVLVVHLSSPTPTTTCYSKVQPFQTTLNLTVLAQMSRVKLEAGQIYLIKVDGHSFEMQVPGADLL